MIIPKLTYQVNASKRYASLRQVYYSLILAQWFKARYRSQMTDDRGQKTEKANNYLKLIDSGNLANLTSIQPYDKQTYFKQYQKSFAEGEYNLQEPVYAPMGQSIRRYMSGGIMIGSKEAGSAISTVIKSARKALLPFGIKLMPFIIAATATFISGVTLADPIKLYSNQNVALANMDDLEFALIHGLNRETYSNNDRKEMFKKLMGMINDDKEKLKTIKQIYFREDNSDIVPEVMIYWKQTLDNFKKYPQNKLRDEGEVENEVVKEEMEKEVNDFNSKFHNYKIKELCWSDENKNVVEELVKLGETVFPNLIYQASQGSEVAVEVLRRNGTKAAEYILQTTPKDKRDDGYFYAVHLLYQIGKPAIGALEKAVKDATGDMAIRELAARALAKIRDPKTIDTIIDVWRTAKRTPNIEEGFQAALIEALGNIRAPKEKNKEIFSEIINVYVGQGWDQLAGATMRSLAQIYMREDNLELKIQIADCLRNKLRLLFSKENLVWQSIANTNIAYDYLYQRLRMFDYISSEGIVNPEFHGLGDAFIKKYSGIYTTDDIRQINDILLKSGRNEDIHNALGDLDISKEPARRFVIATALRYREIDVTDRIAFNPIEILSVYKNGDFMRKTENMDIINQFSIARAVVATLSRFDAPITNDSIYKVLSFILQIRERQAERIVVDRDTNFILLRHEGIWFTSEDMADFFKQKFKIVNSSNFSRDNLYLDIRTDSERVWKNKFADAVINGLKNTTILFSGHGLPEALLLTDTIDPGGEQKGVSYKQFTSILFWRAQKQGGRLSDLTIILDSCYSANFAVRVLNELSGYLRSEKIKDLPVIITTASIGAKSKAYAGSDAIRSILSDETNALRLNDMYEVMTKAGTNEEFSFFFPVSPEEFMRLKQSLGVETNKKPDDKSDEWLNVDLPIIQAQVDLRNNTQNPQSNKGESFVSSAIIDNKGGIAFNALPIQTESVASSALGSFLGVNAFQGDLDVEWAQIQQVFNADIRPSVQRISEYTAAAASSSTESRRADDVLGLIAELLRQEEESQKLTPIDPALKGLLSALEVWK